jgi:hypothetical protein
MLLQEERDLDCMYFNRSLEFFRIHISFTPLDCLIKELGIDNSLGSLTYTLMTPTKDEILDNHRSVLCSFGISTKDEKLDLPSL